MRVTASLLACAGLASASSFKDTSPFIFFSTSETLASSPQIASAASLTRTLTSALSQCLTDVYFIVRAPGLSASDLKTSSKDPNHIYTHYLSGKTPSIRSSFSVAQVVGQIPTAELSSTLATSCGASTVSLDASTGVVIGSTDAGNVTNPRIVHVDFPALGSGVGVGGGKEEDSSSARWHAEHTRELQLSSLIEAHGGESYTVLFTTSPPSAEEASVPADPELEYEMDNSQVPVNMELKRDLKGRKDGKKRDEGKPLFEKYQFFTPALFQGLGVVLLLGSILYVAISAIGGLQVSYAAFDKENGPQANRKQQ